LTDINNCFIERNEVIMKRILSAFSYHLLSIPNPLVHKRVTEKTNTSNERESALVPTYPDLRVHRNEKMARNKKMARNEDKNST